MSKRGKKVKERKKEKRGKRVLRGGYDYLQKTKSIPILLNVVSFSLSKMGERTRPKLTLWD